MTSANSSYKTKMLIDTWKKTLWLPCLCALAFFFSLPVANGLLLQNIDPSNGLTTTDIASMVNTLVLFSNPATKVLLLFSALLAGCTYFYFLHNKRQVDFYHSLPVRRPSLFLNQFLAGAFGVLIPYIAMLFLAVIVILLFGYGTYLDWPGVFASLLFNVLFFLVIYSVIVLAGVLTGNLVIQVLVSAIFLAILPSACLLIASTMDAFYKTFYFSMSCFSQWAIYGSPVSLYFFYGTSNYPLSFGLGIGSLLAFLVIVGLSIFLYKKRPSEAAGHAIAFDLFRPLLKYPVLFLITLGAGLFFYLIGDNSGGWMLFGIVVGALICSRIIEIVYAFDFKAVRRHYLSLGIFFLFFCACMSVPYFDLTGYDRFAPQADEVAEVCVNINGYSVFGDYTADENNYYYNAWDFTSIKEMERMESFRLTGSEGIAAACNIAQSHAERIGADLTSAENNRGTVFLSVIFTMSNGKTVARQYPLASMTEDGEDIVSILSDREYRENQIPDAEQPYPVKLDYINAYSVYTSADNLNSTDQDFNDRLFAACREEILALDIATLTKELPLGSISFVSSNLENSYSMYWDCPIYASFDSVFAILAEVGYEKDFFVLTASEIDHINVTTYSNEDGTVIEEKQITDAEEIAAILATTAPSDTFGSNPFIDIDYEENQNTEYTPILLDNGEALPSRVKTVQWTEMDQ